MKIVIVKLGVILSFLFPYKITKKFESLRNYLYTGWISRQFCKMDGLVEFPIRLVGGNNITVGEGSRIEKDAYLYTAASKNGKSYAPSIIIGKNSVIQRDCFLSAIDRIEIGDNVAITSRTLVIDNVHGDFRENNFTFDNDPDIPDVFLQNVYTRDLSSKGPVVIEDNVHIGMNCVILPGVRIGRNSVIANNSVVSKNIPPFSIVAGNPAKIMLTFGKDKQ